LEIYYKAKYFSDHIQSKSDLKKGQELLESAIQIDNNFVVAYALHALVLQRLGQYGAAETCLDKGKEIALAKNDIQGLASIHNISNIVYFTQGKYQKARKNIEKALKYQIQLNNKLKLAKYRANYAQCLNQLSEIDQAIEQNKLSIKLKEELEETKSLGASYGILANTYYSKGDFSLAFENGIKSLAMCRSNNMTNFEGRLSVIVADILLQLGKYTEMMIYVKQAESILADFDEPFLMGKLELMHSHFSLNESDWGAATKHIDNCIDLFEIAEQRPFLIDAYIHKMELLLEKNEFSLAERVISKIEMQIKKLPDAKERPLLEIFKVLLSPDNLKRPIVREIQSQLSGSIPAEQILSYRHLAKIYKELEDYKAAEECLNEAVEIINQQAQIISKTEDRDSFKNQVYLHKQIQEVFR
jgi:tetratricopeptide (TPR) repeat protein